MGLEILVQPFAARLIAEIEAGGDDQSTPHRLFVSATKELLADLDVRRRSGRIEVWTDGEPEP